MEKEVEIAVKDLLNDKTPRLDMIPNELLKILRETVEKDFTEMLQDTLDNGVLHLALNKKLTSLIPKSNTLTNNTNFRPMAVLTLTYKIMAKTLANKLQSILPKIILPTLTTFVKERSIFDNILMAT